MPFYKGTNFTANRKKYGIATVGNVNNKVENSLVSGETRVELHIHTDKILLGKDCTEYI